MAYTLRVSVLDACQLRCRYCLPNGLETFKKSAWLTLDNYENIARALQPLGLEKIRFTGGEPLLRPDLPQIIAVFARFFPRVKLAVTTNGLRFSTMKEDLKQAGITQVTFHLDTLRTERYPSVMGRGDVVTVLDAINQALEAGFEVKLNMVVQREVNDDELGDFLTLSQQLGSEVRFIELMNTGSATDYVHKTFMSGQEILALIERHTPVVSVGRPHKSAPAESFLAVAMGIPFGLIASDTEPFCAACNRLRLSADGHLRTCLYEPVGHKLSFATDDLPARIAHLVAQKTSFHPLQRKERKSFSMSQVGG